MEHEEPVVDNDITYDAPPNKAILRIGCQEKLSRSTVFDYCKSWLDQDFTGEWELLENDQAKSKNYAVKFKGIGDGPARKARKDN
eukprot:754590-Karenia_brevis.AAC.1